MLSTGVAMELEKIDCDFSVCRVLSVGDVDFTREFVFFAKTPDEVSLVCESAYVPPSAVEVESGWRAFRVSGVLDFGLLGVLAKITGVLADAGISVFAVSTFNTDYILMKSDKFDEGLRVLVQHGYVVRGG